MFLFFAVVKCRERELFQLIDRDRGAWRKRQGGSKRGRERDKPPLPSIVHFVFGTPPRKKGTERGHSVGHTRIMKHNKPPHNVAWQST